MARKVTTADDDAPEITSALFAKMRPMNEVTPGMVEAVKIARRGRPRVEEPKVVFTIRVNKRVQIAWASLGSDQRKKLAADFETSIISKTVSYGASHRTKTNQVQGRRSRLSLGKPLKGVVRATSG